MEISFAQIPNPESSPSWEILAFDVAFEVDAGGLVPAFQRTQRQCGVSRKERYTGGIIFRHIM